MSGSARKDVLVALMAFSVMLGAGAVIPSVRPMFAALGASESSMHAFMSVNMVGAAIGAPLLGGWADRRGLHRLLCVVLALLDAALLWSTTLTLPITLLLALRMLQGAANVGVLSLVLGAISAGERGHARAVGLGGGAVMAAVAIGPAFGGALLSLGPLAPIRAASVLAIMTALIAAVLGRPLDDARAPSQHTGGLRAMLVDSTFVVPAALAFAERFTVGCFVVTFALYAHEVRHLTDAQTALRYSLFLVPFAAATYPLARSRVASRSTLLMVGGVLYGACFIVFGALSGAALAVALVLAGVSSAMVYAPSLCLVAIAGKRGRRATAMAAFHAAGCVGMMLGPAVAGIASATMRAAGVGASTRYATVFVIGGVAQLLIMTLLAPRISALRVKNNQHTHDTTDEAHASAFIDGGTRP
jgi:MFS family permease